jgi:hypothetical protein
VVVFFGHNPSCCAAVVLALLDIGNFTGTG